MIRIDCRDLSPESAATSNQIQSACDCFTKHGYAILDHVVPADKIAELRAEFDDTYPRYLNDAETDDLLYVGGRRYMIPLRFSGGFGDPLVFANPFVVALVRHILGDDAILEAFGAIVSLGGSDAQHIHHDGPLLFNSDISTILPAYALTFALPLVEMNEHQGTTAVWPGSHRWRVRKADEIPPEWPTVPIGSCLLWDFRLYHRGTANQSAHPRPMVYATYARPWYQDPVNFKKPMQRRLLLDPKFVQAIPENSRPLLAHVR